MIATQQHSCFQQQFTLSENQSDWFSSKLTPQYLSSKVPNKQMICINLNIEKQQRIWWNWQFSPNFNIIKLFIWWSRNTKRGSTKKECIIVLNFRSTVKSFPLFSHGYQERTLSFSQPVEMHAKNCIEQKKSSECKRYFVSPSCHPLKSLIFEWPSRMEPLLQYWQNRGGT